MVWLANTILLTGPVRRLVEEDFPGAERITLVMDNLNTHAAASLYKAFPAPKARRLLEKLEFVYTPKHGSWLNMAECEFSVLARQCLNCRLAYMDTVKEEVTAWAKRATVTEPPHNGDSPPRMRASSCTACIGNYHIDGLLGTYRTITVSSRDLSGAPVSA